MLFGAQRSSVFVKQINKESNPTAKAVSILATTEGSAQFSLVPVLVDPPPNPHPPSFSSPECSSCWWSGQGDQGEIPPDLSRRKAGSKQGRCWELGQKVCLGQGARTRKPMGTRSLRVAKKAKDSTRKPAWPPAPRRASRQKQPCHLLGAEPRTRNYLQTGAP